jgi:hypothetical protein
MGIGKRKTSGEPLPRLVWDFKACQVYTEFRTNDGGDWHSEQTPIELADFRCVTDLTNLEIGWIAFVTGQGLDTDLVRVRSGKDYSDTRPSDKHQEGFRLIVSIAGVAHELISTAQTLWTAIDQLDDAFLTGVAERPGQLPIIGITGTTKTTLSNKDEIFSPVLAILDWQKRPPELPVEGIPLFKRQKRKDSGAAPSTAPYVRPKPRDMDDEIPF